MIMKHERNEDKNDFLLFLLPEIFTVIAGSTAVYAMGIFGKQLSVENALRNAVMTAMGLAVAGFFLRRNTEEKRIPTGRLLNRDNTTKTGKKGQPPTGRNVQASESSRQLHTAIQKRIRCSSLS